MHKEASKYITEIKGQRQRLRNNMPDATFCTWHAETLTILEYIPEIAPLKQRFIDVERSNDSVADKVEEVRGILSSVVRRISSQLFGTGIVPASPLPNTGGIVFAPTITQNLLKSIDFNLDTLLERVDQTEGVSEDQKTEAAPLVTKLWDFIRTGSRDNAVYWDLGMKLALLGFNVQHLLSGP